MLRIYQSTEKQNPARHLARKVVAMAAAVALTIGWQVPIFAATSSGTLTVRGTAGPTCTISITAYGAATTLPITTAGSHTITVGRVAQTCNNPAGYTLDVTSATCSAGTAPAKLDDGATHTLNYSVNFDNTQPPDGSWEVTNLLATACTGQIARTVATTVTADNSEVGVVFTGSTTLFPGTYQDVITVTMTTT